MRLTEEHAKLLPRSVTDASVADCGGVPVPVTYSSSDRPKAVSDELQSLLDYDQFSLFTG